MWPPQHHHLFHSHPPLNQSYGDKRLLIRSDVPLPAMSYEDLAQVPGIEMAPFAIPPLPLFDPALDPTLSNALLEGGDIFQSSVPAERLSVEPEPEVFSIIRLTSVSPGPVARGFASFNPDAEAYQGSSTKEDAEGTFDEEPQGAIQNRHQPHRKAKEGHLLNSKTHGLVTGQDLYPQLLNKAFLEVPISPRVAESKATHRGRYQSKLQTSQESGSFNEEALDLSLNILDKAQVDLKKSMLKSGLSKSGKPLTDLSKKRLELSLKKGFVLQDYANGQTDAEALMQQYDITRKNLNSWVGGFRQEQAASGLKFPDLVWPLRQSARSAPKRSPAEASELNPELNKDEDYQPGLERLSKKSRKQQAQNPFYRLRTEGGRFASFRLDKSLEAENP